MTDQPADEHVDGMTPGNEAARLAAWHLNQAIEEIQAAAALLHHESETHPDHAAPFIPGD